MRILAKMLYGQRACHNPAGPVSANLAWDPPLKPAVVFQRIVFHYTSPACAVLFQRIVCHLTSLAPGALL